MEEARRGVEALGAEPEVVVVDNGSRDGSVGAAGAAGARVVEERRRGYGNALSRGIREAKGEILILGDADGSYRFDALGPLVAAVDAGADLVLGSRLRGRIDPGAMPWLHRHLGTPILTGLVNLLFRTRISDVNCGQRALRAGAVPLLQLRAGGMEFASEMVIKASLAGLRIAEVPVDFRKDRRDRPPHLRTWRDGWRHLRFLLLFAPNLVLLAPGAAFLLFGAFLAGPSFLGRPGPGWARPFAGAAFVLLGAQLIQVGLIVKTWYHVEGFYRRPYLDRLFKHIGFEAGLLLGLGLLAVGVVVGVPLVVAWREDMPSGDPGRIASALTFLVLGAQVVTSSVILSVLGIRRR